MRNQFVRLFKCAFVEQEVDALTGGHFAFFVLPFTALFAAAVFGEVIAFLYFCKFLFEVHGGRIIAGWRGQELRRRPVLVTTHTMRLASFARPDSRWRLSPHDSRWDYSMLEPRG